MGLLTVLATCTGYGALWLWLQHPSHPGSIPKSQAAQSAGTQLLSHWLPVVTAFPNPGSPKAVFPNCLPTLSGPMLKCTPQPKMEEDLATLPLLPSVSLEHTDETEPIYMPRSPGSEALLGSLHAHLRLLQKEPLAGPAWVDPKLTCGNHVSYGASSRPTPQKKKYRPKMSCVTQRTFPEYLLYARRLERLTGEPGTAAVYSSV